MENAKKLTLVLSFALMVLATAAQTKPAKKKPAAKPISVYVCDSQQDKLYHKRMGCANLNKCSGEIKHVKSVAELKKYKRKSCTRCLNT